MAERISSSFLVSRTLGCSPSDGFMTLIQAVLKCYICNRSDPWVLICQPFPSFLIWHYWISVHVFVLHIDCYDYIASPGPSFFKVIYLGFAYRIKCIEIEWTELTNHWHEWGLPFYLFHFYAFNPTEFRIDNLLKNWAQRARIPGSNQNKDLPLAPSCGSYSYTTWQWNDWILCSSLMLHESQCTCHDLWYTKLL